jgi:hypothetical protein
VSRQGPILPIPKNEQYTKDPINPKENLKAVLLIFERSIGEQFKGTSCHQQIKIRFSTRSLNHPTINNY